MLISIMLVVGAATLLMSVWSYSKYRILYNFYLGILRLVGCESVVTGNGHTVDE
jgi:hypothetical protein